MKDIQFLRLSEKWALAYDKNQWIVQRRNTLSRNGKPESWRAVSFITSSKDTLLRVLREKGVEVEAEAQGYIATMPDTFREWIDLKHA